MAAVSDTTNSSRRAFLSALVTLPFVGGSLKLLGRPMAAAVPVSPALLRRYLNFLSRELFATQVEITAIESHYHFVNMGFSLTDDANWSQLPLWWQTRRDTQIETTILSKPPSSRVAVVLGAAGVEI